MELLPNNFTQKYLQDTEPKPVKMKVEEGLGAICVLIFQWGRGIEGQRGNCVGG